MIEVIICTIIYTIADPHEYRGKMKSDATISHTLKIPLAILFDK